MAAVRVRGSATESAIVIGSQIGAGETRLDLAGELDLATAPMLEGTGDLARLHEPERGGAEPARAVVSEILRGDECPG